MNIRDFEIGQDKPMFLIAGPCQIETLDHARMMAETLCEITSQLGLGFVYKSSYDKANRSSFTSTRGVGLDEGLRILDCISREYSVPVLTDVHDVRDVPAVAEVVDVIQIPAFLCRQTDLLEAAAQSASKYNRIVNIKKGQFLAPTDMQNVVDKFIHFGHDQIMLTERGTTFGYNRLVVDMTGLPIMAAMGVPVIMDATHAVQEPGGKGLTTGGRREGVEYLARAGASVGIAGLFVETHEDPDTAPSDGPNMVALSDMARLLRPVMEIDRIVKHLPSGG